MKNAFYLLINQLASNKPIAEHNPKFGLYEHVARYIMLSLPTENMNPLRPNAHQAYRVNEHHITIFKDFELQGKQSAFHYTANMFNPHNSSFRLRVFFNESHEPICISWTHKITTQGIDSYQKIDLPTDEVKLFMAFAKMQVKTLLSLIRKEQRIEINNAKEQYDKADALYHEIIDSQTEGMIFAKEQALSHITEMKNACSAKKSLVSGLLEKNTHILLK